MKDIEEVLNENYFNKLVNDLINELEKSWNKNLQDISEWFKKEFEKKNIVNKKIQNLIKEYVLYFYFILKDSNYEIK